MLDHKIIICKAALASNTIVLTALYPNPPLLSHIGFLCIVEPRNHHPVPNSSPATFTDSWMWAFSSYSSFTPALASHISDLSRMVATVSTPNQALIFP